MAELSSPNAPLYVYGLCLSPDPPLDFPPGIEGEVTLVTVGDLAALVEADIDLEVIQADHSRLLTAVLSHDRVLCHLFQQTPLLPLRFGTQLPSRAQLEAFLGQEQAAYRAKLTALADQAEYQIKLIPADLDPPPLPEGLKGRDYFLAKKQRLQDLAQAQQQQQDERQALLQAIAAAYANTVVDDTNPETKVYLLLPRSQQAALAQALAQWQTPHWQMQMSAALPPYHFV